MQIKINIDEKRLKEAGLGQFVNSLKFLNPVMMNQMMSGFGRPMRRQTIPLMQPKQLTEIERAESLAVINLKQDVSNILESKSKEELIKFILSRLDVNSLGRLVQ